MSKTITPSDLIPWKMPITSSTDWQATWPELQCSAVDPVQVVADLYLTEGLMVHGFVAPFDIPEPVKFFDGDRIKRIAQKLNLTEEHAELRNKRVAARLNGGKQQMALIAQQARAYQGALIEAVFPTFWAYTQAACGGELRHHNSIGGVSLGQTRKNAWVQWRTIWEQDGVEALKLMSKLFNEMGGSLGGPKWAAASDLLIAYHNNELGPNEFANKKVFVDRVLSLQHNGGCFLSKRTWANSRLNRANEHVSSGSFTVAVSDLTPNHQSMVPILDAHAANPPDAKSLYSAASRTVRAMTFAYMNLAEVEGVQITAQWGTVKTPHTQWSPTVDIELPVIPEPTTAPVVAAPQAEPGAIQSAPSNQLKGADIVDSGLPFKVVFTITKIRSGWQQIELTTPVLKVYSFKSKDQFVAKTFYTGHMLKHVYPGSKAMEMTVHFMQGKKVTEPVCASGPSSWETPSKLGAALYNLSK